MCADNKVQKNLSEGPRHVASHYAKYRCTGETWIVRLSTDQNSIYKAPKPKAMEFREVFNFGAARKKAPKSWIKCSGKFFGKDIAKHMRKQCMCEAKPRREPYRCAKEGQWCRACKGVIYYGLYKRNGKALDIEEMMSKNYRYFEKKNKDKIKCDNKKMGGDPNRGHYKQCMCDDVGFINIEKIRADERYNRQKEEIRRNKRRIRLMAIQRRRRLQQEKERRERLIREREEREKRRVEQEAIILRHRQEAEVRMQKEQEAHKTEENMKKLKND